MKGRRTAWLLIGVLLVSQLGLPAWGSEAPAEDAGQAIVQELPPGESAEEESGAQEPGGVPEAPAGEPSAEEGTVPDGALPEMSSDLDVIQDQSVAVEAAEIDREALAAQDTYFVVRYGDGSLEVRELGAGVGHSSLEAAADSAPVADLQDHIDYYESLPAVEAAEPLVMRQVSDIGMSYTPNDPLYGNAGMWGLKWIGADRMFRMIPQANLSEVIVAVLDTGMDMDHSDLAGSLATVTVNGVQVHGFDAVSEDYSPDDGHGHGTHVAGTIGAAVNNGIGVAGVAAGVKILPVRVLDNNGDGLSVDVIQGIRWAADQGADVINLSLGGVSFSQLEQDAVNYAVSKGAIVVAATGNSSNHWTSGDADLYFSGEALRHSAVHYPAAYENAVGVGAVGLYGAVPKLLISDFSNTARPADAGAALNPVDVTAPGEAVLSTHLNNGNATMSGTSMATPHVAALAALLKAKNPAWTPAQIEARMKSTAVMVTAGDDASYGGNASYYGAGVINAYAALGEATDTRLDDLIINGRSLDFAPMTAAYEMTWVSTAPSFELKPVANNSFQSIVIDGTPYVGSNFAVIPLVDGKKTVTVQVTAKDGNATGSYTIDAYRLKALGALPAGEVVMTGDSVRLSLDGSYDPGETLQLTIPDGNDDATLTVPITDNGTTITGALPQTAITKNDGAGTVSVSIPEGTTVSASTASGWDGTLSMPTVSTTTGATVTGGTANLAVTLGAEGVSLTFSKAIRIRIPGMAGKKVGYVHNGAVVEITRTLATDSQAAADAMPAGAEGKINVGSDLVVWTKHLTEFVAYTPASVPSNSSTQSGGGGGGGGGGVSRVIRGGAAAVLEMDNLVLKIPEGSYPKEYRIDLNMIRYSKSPFSAPLVPLTPVYGVRKTIRNELDKPYVFTVAFEYDVIRSQYPTEQIRLYLLDETLRRWRPVENSQLSEKRSPSGVRLLVLSAEVNEFTEFAAIAEPAVQAGPLTPEVPVTAPTPAEESLTDIQTHWGRASIEKLIAKSAVSGYPDGTFRPDTPITRAEFLAILVKAQGMTGSTPSNFSDLNGHWARGVIERAMAYGITGGYADGLFRPDAPITREEMAVMIDRSLRYASEEPLRGFTDGSAISAWARESLQRIVSRNIMGGYPDGSFRPQGLATRAEACSVILKTVTP